MSGNQIRGNRRMRAQKTSFAVRPFQYYVRALLKKFNARPPQPYLCIRATIDDGCTVYINVLTWKAWYKDESTIFDFSTIVVPKHRELSCEVFAVFGDFDVIEKLPFRSEDESDVEAALNILCRYLEDEYESLKFRDAVVLTETGLWGELNDDWISLRKLLVSEMRTEYVEELADLDDLMQVSPTNSTSTSTSTSNSTSNSSSSSNSRSSSSSNSEEASILMPPPSAP